MFDRSGKYGNFLTILLVVIIIAVLGLIIYFGYDVYKNFTTEQEASEFVNNFGQDIKPGESDDDSNTEVGDGSTNTLNEVERLEGNNNNNAVKPNKTQTYQGFEIVGTIEIPTTKVSYPIIATASKSAIEVSVAMLYGPGPNQPGNTVIIGHNYRDGKFFANNKKLSIGDKIYITDNNKQKLTYTIYDKFETAENDTDYMMKNTNGGREISLSTCTDDSSARLIILARCDSDN